MRTVIVVERNNALRLSLGFCNICKLFTPFEPFCLQNAVHPLRYCIVSRLVVLRHTDGYMMVLQTFHIGIAAVLYASVRVMDQTAQILFPCTAYRHFQRPYRIGGMKTWGKRPSYYLVGIGISHQMKVADALLQIYIGYVAYPKLIRRRHGNSLHQIRVFMEAVVAVRRAVALQRLEHQPVAPEKSKERVPAQHHLLTVYKTEHYIELEGSYTRSFGTYILYRGYQNLFMNLSFSGIELVLIVGLPTVTKQATKGADAAQCTFMQGRYCLVPGFFLIGMLNSFSAMSIIVL
jgi:hypothetical protein